MNLSQTLSLLRKADDSSGDEVCFAGQPLLAEKEPSSASDRGSRACARARMETLGIKAREANGNGKDRAESEWRREVCFVGCIFTAKA